MVRPHGKRPDPHRPPRDHWASSRWARATISSRSTTKASDGSGEIEPFPRIESNNEAHSFFPAGNVLAYYQRAAGSDQNPGYLDHVVGRRARATAFLGDTVPRADSVVLSRHAGSRTLRTSPAGTRFTCSPIRTRRANRRLPTWSPRTRLVTRWPRALYRRGNAIWAAPVTLGATFEVETPQKLFEGRFVAERAASGSQTYNFSPDGQRFLLVQPTDQSSQLHVVVNWFES